MANVKQKPIHFKLIAQNRSGECTFEIIEQKLCVCKKAQDILQDSQLTSGFSQRDLIIISWAAASPQTLELFQFHWDRLLRNTAFQAYPYCEQTISELKKRYFWKKLTLEILNDPDYSAARIAEETAIPIDLINKLSWDELHPDYLPLFIGEKLLYLHQTVCSELQQEEGVAA